MGSGDSSEKGEAEKEEGTVGSGDSSEEGEEHSVKRKSKVRTQTESGRRQNTSSRDDSNSTQEQAAAQGTTKSGSLGSSNGDSDTEREVSDSQAGQNTKEERKSRSSNKSSKNGQARSCSSSSDSSPEPTGQKGKARSSSSSSDSGPEPTGRKAASRCGEDHPAVARLKRYIRACGAHRNYKKLLGSCSSHKARLSVLRAELEALGMKGNPSLEKCRALKLQREEAAEVAALDVANIISSTGRPRRRNAWNPSGEGTSPGETYRRTLDSEEEQPRQAPPDWSHMRDIISSDGDSS